MNPPSQTISRRRLLRGTVAASLAVLVAGCGGGGSGSSAPERAEGDGGRALEGVPIEVWRDPG